MIGPGYIILLVFAGWFGVSALYRCLRGMPILFLPVEGADFLDRTALGRNLRNCLVVAIRAGRLRVRPVFPINMLSLAEAYGLEFDVPLEYVSAQLLPGTARAPSYFSPLARNVRVRIQRPEGTARDVYLLLANPEAFVASVSRQREHRGEVLDSFG